MSLYKEFNQWLFDGDLTTSIPNKELMLKYNSPITPNYLINIMLKNGAITDYLNKYINNFNVRYIDKEELFMFFKFCIQKFKISKHSVYYKKRAAAKSKLYNILRMKEATLKEDDIDLLCDLIDDSDEKEMIYSSFGLDAPKKEKIKVGKKKTKKSSKGLTLKKFLKDNFKTLNVK